MYLGHLMSSQSEATRGQGSHGTRHPLSGKYASPIIEVAHPKRSRRSHSKFPTLEREVHLPSADLNQHLRSTPVARNHGCHQQDCHQLAVPAEPLRAGERDCRRSLRPREQHPGPEGQPSSSAVRLCPRGKNCILYANRTLSGIASQGIVFFFVVEILSEKEMEIFVGFVGLHQISQSGCPDANE